MKSEFDADFEEYEEEEHGNLPVIGHRQDAVPVTKRDRSNALAWSIIEENLGPFLVHFVESVEESGLSVDYQETDQGYKVTVGNYLLTIQVERLLND